MSDRRMNPADNGLTIWIGAALLLAWCAGMFGRGFWTPDEPREADIAWRMSWQADKAVPLLAGDAFCEKPPLTYWVAALPIASLGMHAWTARLPNLVYALLTAVCVGALSRRLGGRTAGIAAAAAVGTLLLSYQVAIWLATDAPLLAFTSLALLGVHRGFNAAASRDRLLGYTLMHAALALGFLSKSAFGWMVPTLCLAALIVWERRWRELSRWELYAGLIVQAAMILPWVWHVYAGPDGPQRLKVFFWNNLAGRLTSVDAPAELQYANAHRNSPGKYFVEMPAYLWPWTLLVAAAVRRAWLSGSWRGGWRSPAVRFATASSVPALLLLSLAATARNVYMGPAIPGIALLLGWWAAGLAGSKDRWDALAIRATAALLMVASLLCAAAAAIVWIDARVSAPAADRPSAAAVAAAVAGIVVAAYLAVNAWRRVDRGPRAAALAALFFSYCALLIGPAWASYDQIDRWQDLSRLGAAIKADGAGRPLILLAPDETTRAFVDLYVRSEALVVPEADLEQRWRRLADLIAANPASLILVQDDGREYSATIARLAGRFGRAVGAGKPGVNAVLEALRLTNVRLKIAKRYSLPNGRRYVLLEPGE